MASLDNPTARADIVNRLKRAEGQLRGVQRMVEEGETCVKVAQQLSAVRKALDSTYVRMTVCLVEQEVQMGEVRHRCRRRCDGLWRREAGHGERHQYGRQRECVALLHGR